jgi:hypothetical protein
MLIKITVRCGIVEDVETSEPALVQIHDLDVQETSTFETVAQDVKLEDESGEEMPSRILRDGMVEC